MTFSNRKGQYIPTNTIHYLRYGSSVYVEYDKISEVLVALG